MATGSTTLVVASEPRAADELARYSANLNNHTVEFKHGDTTARTTLDALDIPSYHHVIVVAYSDNLDVQRADAHTLITLLQLLAPTTLLA